jgi:hypothetical protein
MSFSIAEEPLTPPRPFFTAGDSPVLEAEGEPQRARSSVETSPDTPRNPTSPPASVVSFSRPSTADISLVNSHCVFGSGISNHFSVLDERNNIPSSRFNTSHLGSSIYGTTSRPGTAEFSSHSRCGSGVGLRESFSRPPSRPLISLSPSLPAVKVTRDRMRSTMLSMNDPLSKPWLDERRDPYSRVAYLVTYGVMFLGVIAGAVRCYFGLKNVPLITSNLCMVLDEEFDGTEDSTFGQDGKWLREVQMDGYG